jgi:transposase
VDWKAKVDLFEQLRREYEFGIGTIAGVAAKYGVHRRLVRRAIGGALPPAQHYPERAKPKLGAVGDFIDKLLEEDRRAPRKQRHTARRIHRRILREFPDTAVAESTVRNHVRQRKRQMGVDRRETFVPQSYSWAQEAQVDWYEAWSDLGGERTKVQVFAMRSMASGAAFHRAYLHATQQAFLEAHEHAFAYFGGVFQLLRYDNLTSAVRKVLRGHRREETVRFIAFRSHWRFAAEFCNPGEGHEKGGIEGEGGYFRRNHLVPVPDVADLDALNALLLSGCREDEARVLDGRRQSVGAALAEERGYLLTRATEGFDLAEIVFPLVDKQGCIAVKTNFYSVPIRAGTRVEARIHPLHVEIWHAGRLIARHERCHSRRQHVLDLEHYLDVLSYKPGAFAGSKPLAQWRDAGRWPACYDELWERLRVRHGKQNGTRAMVAVLALGQEFGHDHLRTAVAATVSHGASDVAAVRYLLTEAGLHKARPGPVDVGALACYDRPLPNLADYDTLLSGPCAGTA